jgi:hypothetical protein
MDVDDVLKNLPGMNRDALCRQWRECFRKPAPAGVRREILVRILAYRVQEQAYGGLSAQSRRRLDEVASALSTGDPKAAISNMVSAKPGTQLIRSWKGKTHTVTIEESGYQYEGRRYRSLSEIARCITGTQWSGPLFFGLKSRKAKKGVERAH